MSEYHSQPRTDLARAIERGMNVISESVEDYGGEVKQIFVAIVVDGMDPDAATCGQGFTGPEELIMWLILHAENAAREVGMPIAVVPGYSGEN